MIKSILILFFAAIFANQIFIAVSENCSEQQSNARSDNCTFECIQILYEKKFCKAWPIGLRSTPVHPVEDNIFETLMQYNVIAYNVSSVPVLSTGKHNDCDDTPPAEKHAERFFQPMYLAQYFNCTQNLTVKSDDPNFNCTVDVERLYDEIDERFNETQKWCMAALGISKAYEKFQIARNATNSQIEVTENDTDSTATDVETDSTTPQSTTAATTTTTVTTQDNANATETMQTTTSNANQTSSTEFTSTSTITTEASITPTKTSKSSDSVKKLPKSKKPTRPAEHYGISIITIVGIVGGLFAILIVSAIILSYFVNRRKRMDIRSDSRTYVFDTRE